MSSCFRRHLNEFQRGQLGFKLKPIVAELAEQRKGTSDFISDTAKAAIEKRWTEKKMCYRQGGRTVLRKASD
ncbi:MAG TPA: hypothetical protein VEH06_14075 [Candidatus Bathyarchaeia archaeon]|nr:hypothetical protein [Candidatus Bathyarchaeia archaeon]